VDQRSFFSRIKFENLVDAVPTAAANFWIECGPDFATQILPIQKLINAAAAGSPYLTKLILNHRDFVVTSMARDPDVTLGEIIHEILLLETLISRTEIMSALRIAKQKAALLIGLADIGGVWSVTEVTKALTQFADACLNAAVNFLLRENAALKKLSLIGSENPAKNCGYVVLAMGKHGAYELNYSSDIDLIVLYDPETAPLSEGVEPSTFFVRFTRDLVSVLQDITEHGYVFRIDLRLRPDPRATQMAIALEAAAIYYENQGQNWERAAMIKARPAAGDIALGEEFLQRLTSYIWRKYLDYAAIADVQSLKRQIHAVKGHGEIAIKGHNLKLGRGGIREIEFFVQTQQLIAGGRNPKLRGRSTLEMLDALAEAKWIEKSTASELQKAYVFLRMLEHRAQMVDDQQTHLVPSSDTAFESFARFSGFENGQALSNELRATLQTVQRHYSALFEDAGDLGSETGSLVFTGGEDDPATLETLEGMGFKHASETSATIRAWHFGRYPATRTARAREILTELMPKLLKVLSNSGDADQAFLAFDQFLQGLPSGVQLFSMLKANPNVLELIAQILGQAPRLAEQLKRQPRTLEAVAGADFARALPTETQLQNEFDNSIANNTAIDEAMDVLRVLVREHQFRVGVRLLADTISPQEASLGFSNIADQAIIKLLAVIITEMKNAHGVVDGGRCAVIALGKLGGHEMTASSDLDLMLIYDHHANAELSDGVKPLSPNQYYARLTQRLITALSAPTAEGTLFEVDLRLRPSGSKGPVAVSFSSFLSYQKLEAWTWEKLALTRARVVAGDLALEQELQNAIQTILIEKRDTNIIRNDVCEMRNLMLKEQAKKGPWDIKRAKGGLVEVEFIAQYLQLIANDPKSLSTNTHLALLNAEKNQSLSPHHASILHSACQLFQNLTQVLRLCVLEYFDPGQSSKSLNQAIARTAGMPDIAATEALLIETQNQVSAIFENIIGR
jgi:[glutamine synthetase] adenylyltransferase / [glutamine synthetase]-adenylyl-L-tyrosine phosphorylase